MTSWYNEEHASAMWRLLELVVPIHISQLQATSSKLAEAENGIAAQASIHDFMVHVRERLVELAQREDVARPANESFAMRDYRRDTCGSSRTTALRLLLFIGKRFAQVCSGAVFDKKSLVRTTLLSFRASTSAFCRVSRAPCFQRKNAVETWRRSAPRNTRRITRIASFRLRDMRISATSCPSVSICFCCSDSASRTRLRALCAPCAGPMCCAMR